MSDRNINCENEIPIFFSSDDNYIPYLDVTVASIIANASKEYNYRIIILNTGIKPENIAKVKKNERPGFKIDFMDISRAIRLRGLLKQTIYKKQSSS